jgi:hypothetical protein
MAGNEVKVLFGSVDKLSPSIKKIGGLLADLTAISVTAAAAIATIHDSLKLAGEREQSLRKIEQTIKSTGGAAGLAAYELREMAEGFQDTTKFSSEMVATSQSVLLTFTKIGSETFPRATEAVLNMSEAFGTNMKEASIQLGKALNDPIKGVSALKEVGVSFTAEQSKMIEAMVETGDVAGAQGVILDELAVEFGGVASAAADTFSGSMVQAKNAMDDAKAALGEALLPAIASVALKMKDAAEDVEAFFRKFRENEADKAVRVLEEIGAAAEDIARAQAFAGLIRNAERFKDASGGVESVLRGIGEAVDFTAEQVATGTTLNRTYSTSFEDLAMSEGNLAGASDSAAEATAKINALLAEQDRLNAAAAASQEELAAKFREAGVEVGPLWEALQGISEIDDPMDTENLQQVTELMQRLRIATGDVTMAWAGSGEIAEDTYTELSRILAGYMEGMTSYHEVLKLVTELEQQRAALTEQKKTGNTGGGGDGGDDEEENPLSDKQRKDIEILTVMLDDFRLSDLEKQQSWYDMQLELLGDNEEAKLLLQEVYGERLNAMNDKARKLEEKHLIKELAEKKKRKDKELEEDKERKQQEFTNSRDALGNIGALAKLFGREGFEVAKAAAAGQATMDTYAAANKALATAPAGFQFLAAAAAVAAGMANVYQIMSQAPPAAHGGLEYVPEEQTYLLQQGERVLSPNQNAQLVDTLSTIQNSIAFSGVPGAADGGTPWGGPDDDTGGGIGATTPYNQVSDTWSIYNSLAWDIRKGRQSLDDVTMGMMGGPGSDWDRHSRHTALTDAITRQNLADMSEEERSRAIIMASPSSRARYLNLGGDQRVLVNGENMSVTDAIAYWDAQGAEEQNPYDTSPMQVTSDDVAGGGAPVAISTININPTNPESLKDITAEDWEEILMGGLAPAIESVARNGALSIPSNASMEV